MSYTKEEWILATDAKGIAIFTERDLICRLHKTHGSQKEMEANAKLIVEAPELLKACIEMVKYFDTEYLPQCDAYYELKKAIKNAKS